MGNKHMKKMHNIKEIEKIKDSKSCKLTPIKKKASFSDKDFIEDPRKNYPNSISKEFSTNVSLNENTLNEFNNEGIIFNIIFVNLIKKKLQLQLITFF